MSLNEPVELINALVKYGLAHEDVIYPITESVMTNLYLDAAKSAAEDMGEEVDEDGELMFDPSVTAVYGCVADEDKDQFVRDLRNAVSVAMDGDFDGAVDQVLALR